MLNKDLLVQAQWLRVMKDKEVVIEGHGFVLAFLDTVTNEIIVCKKPDGSLSNVHVLSGLPKNILERENYIKTLASGYARDGAFYTRDEAFALIT